MIVIDFMNKIKEYSAFIENKEFENPYIYLFVDMQATFTNKV